MPHRSLSFEEYLAGGFLGNAPIFFFTYAVKCLFPDGEPTPALELVSTLTVVFGGIVSGYLVVRRIDCDHLRIGLKTGLSSFLVNLTFSSVIFEGTTIVYGLYILLLFCVGGVTGAWLRWATMRRRKTLQSDATEEPSVQEGRESLLLASDTSTGNIT